MAETKAVGGLLAYAGSLRLTPRTGSMVAAPLGPSRPVNYSEASDG
jgi:hypothetical protein